MTERIYKIGILHYSAPPVIGGVENVIQAHSRLFVEAGYPTTVLAGRGEKDALPRGTELIQLPELDSQDSQILAMSQELERGRVPDDFEDMVDHLTQILEPCLRAMDVVMVHNVFTKHFNLPLTAALFRLLDQKVISHCVAWCHDITWTSPHSRSKAFEGYPWDLLRTQHPDVTYVAVSQNRRQELSQLFGCPAEQIRVIYNGVNPNDLFALSNVGRALIERLNLWESDLNLLMPVRVTQAKNIELALHVAAALKARSIHPKFIVTGPPDPHDQLNMEYFHSLLSLREQLGIDQEVRFIYESGTSYPEPLVIGISLVAELLRMSDALFMPSRREGFGMPILEAGLIGIPVFCADTIPAAREIAARNIVMFSPEASPDQVADLILQTMESSPIHRLRRRVRQNLTWEKIFQHEILPLLEQGDS